MTANSGHYNSGHYNSGYCNSGKYNSGDRNSGYCNSGDYNSGDRNSGDYNSGKYNSGDRNSGDYNSGDRNSGKYNSGYYNSGNYNSGDCNETNSPVRIFDEFQVFEFSSEKHNKFRSIIASKSKPILEWVSESSMSYQEKTSNPTYKTTGGYLKKNKAGVQVELTKEEEDFLKSIKGFSPEKLLRTTGIDITKKTVKVIFDGHEIQITKECADNILKQLQVKNDRT